MEPEEEAGPEELEGGGGGGGGGGCEGGGGGGGRAGGGRDVIWVQEIQNVQFFSPPMGYPPIIHRSMQKTSTSKSDLGFSRRKKERKKGKTQLKVCKGRDGHEYMDGCDMSSE